MTFIPRNKFSHMAIDHPYELTGQILDCLFSWFIIGKLTSLSVNYKLQTFRNNGAQNDK